MEIEEASQAAQFIKKTLIIKRKELEDIRQQIYEATNRLNILIDEVEHYEGVWASIKQILNLPDEQEESSEKPIASLHHTAFTAPQTLEKLNKTEAILEVVRQSGIGGRTPKEVIDVLNKSGVDIEENYVYAILSREAKRGKLSKNGKKYLMNN